MKLGALVVLFLPAAVAAAPGGEVDPAYKHASAEAYEEWRDMKFGLRICMGYYNMRGIEASWPVLRMSNEKKHEYFELYKQYNPTDFDAEQWMDLLDRGGLKFFTILTKHHDGFCMYDTKTRIQRRVNWIAPGGPRIEECDIDYDIMDSPFKRDIIKELCDAAHKRKIAVDLYFSHVDWYDADFRNDRYHPLKSKGYMKKSDPQAYARMIARHREQIREVLTRYGKVDMMCLDMDYLPGIEWPDMLETLLMIRKLQPDVLLRKRGIGVYGDYETPENWVPAGPDDSRVKMPWMVIYNLAQLYAYDPNPNNYKPGTWVVENLVDICAKGGNFMIITGPSGKGYFHPKCVEAIEYTGDWLKVNGEAIYKTRPWKHYQEGSHIRFTRSKNSRYVYAICLKWPGEKLKLRSVRAREGSEILMLGVDRPLAWHNDEYEGLIIEIPDTLQAEENRPCRQAYAFKIEGIESETVEPPRLIIQGDPFAPEATIRAELGVEGCEIRYTTDGTDPLATSMRFAEPVLVSAGGTLKVRALKQGMVASRVVSFSPGTVKINFQPKDVPIPAGYLADFGEVFGSRIGGLSYGWSRDHTKETRSRPATPEGTLLWVFNGERWEIGVPDGTYQVTVCVGDVPYPSDNIINVERVNFCDGLKLNQGTRTVTKNVRASNGTYSAFCPSRTAYT